MKEFRMRAFFGIVGLAGAGFLVSSLSTTAGCSSSNNSTGTAGSTGSAGSSGSAGTSGTAGTQGGGGNSGGGSGGGGGDSGGLKGCQMSELPRNPPVIADFTAVDGGAPVIAIGGTYAYASPPGAVQPTATMENGGWHIKLDAPGMAMAQYIGVGIYFNGNAAGDECIDGTAYTGVKFDITGTIGGTGCSGQFSINDSEHSDSTANPSNPDKKAGGPAGSYAPQTALTIGTTATVMMPFAGAGAPTGGSPATAVDKSKLTGIQWQFTVASGAANACMVDIVIDNIGFY